MGWEYVDEERSMKELARHSRFGMKRKGNEGRTA
jgi:hypothetical protein